VCSRCVELANSDTQVAHATEGEGSVPEGSSWQELCDTIKTHYATEHKVQPDSVTVGASLANGTTISGNIAFHAGNDGPGSGLDADTVDGTEESDLGSSSADVRDQLILRNAW
jgi:phage gp45-like